MLLDDGTDHLIRVSIIATAAAQIPARHLAIGAAIEVSSTQVSE
jgi:hypothetical protein